MSPHRCLICFRIVMSAQRQDHLTREHPIVAATFKTESANIDVLFERPVN